MKIGFAFPANSQAASPVVWKFFTKLPEVSNIKVFIITTLNESAFIKAPLYKILKKKGFIPTANRSFSMPNNLVVSNIDEKQDNERMAAALKESAVFAQMIASGEESYNTKDNGSSFVSFLSRNTVLPWIFMRLLFKLEVDSVKCNNCGLCIKNCPSGNIKAGKFPLHKGRCEFCMRCAAYCPNRSVYIKGRKDIIIKRVSAGSEG